MNRSHRGSVDDHPMDLGTIAIDDRESVLLEIFGELRPAAVAVPILRRDAGWQVLLTVRSAINGHTGRPMRNAGQVVLPGGAVEPDESSLEAAIRELREEALGTDSPPSPRTRAAAWLGGWVVENGYRVDGHLVELTAVGELARLRPAVDEVAEVFTLRLADVFADPPRWRHRRVVGERRDGRPIFSGCFASPQAFYPCVQRAEPREIWGAAGKMLLALVERYDGSLAAFEAEMTRAVGAPEVAAASPTAERGRLARRSVGALRFLRRVIGAPPVPIVPAPSITAVTGRETVLQLDARLPLGASSKVRSLGAILARMAHRRAIETPEAVERRGARWRREGHPGLALQPAGGEWAVRQLAALSVALDGLRAITASTGSHARAVAEVLAWLAEHRIASVPLHVLVTDDIPKVKIDRLHELGATVEMAEEFSAATDAAIRRSDAANRRGERHWFVPTDAIDRFSPVGGHDWKDGMPGFATAALEAVEWLRRQRPEHRWRMIVPTSGGATWAACRAWATARGEALEVLAAADELAMVVHASLAAGEALEDRRMPDAPPINGLTQRGASPYAIDLVVDTVRDPDAVVLAVRRSTLPLARFLVWCDGGVLPEPAGAAAVAALLPAALDAEASATLGRVCRRLGLDEATLGRLGLDRPARDAAGVDADAFARAVDAPIDRTDRGPANRGPANRGPADRGPADRGPADRGPDSSDPGTPTVDIALITGAWTAQPTIDSRPRESADEP